MAFLKLGPGSIVFPGLIGGGIKLGAMARFLMRGVIGSGTKTERVLHSTWKPRFNNELRETGHAENEETTSHLCAGPE
jgi:hypothetical protein